MWPSFFSWEPPPVILRKRNFSPFPLLVARRRREFPPCKAGRLFTPLPRHDQVFSVEQPLAFPLSRGTILSRRHPRLAMTPPLCQHYSRSLSVSEIFPTSRSRPPPYNRGSFLRITAVSFFFPCASRHRPSFPPLVRHTARPFSSRVFNRPPEFFFCWVTTFFTSNRVLRLVSGAKLVPWHSFPPFFHKACSPLSPGPRDRFLFCSVQRVYLAPPSSARTGWTVFPLPRQASFPFFLSKGLHSLDCRLSLLFTRLRAPFYFSPP